MCNRYHIIILNYTIKNPLKMNRARHKLSINPANLCHIVGTENIFLSPLIPCVYDYFCHCICLYSCHQWWSVFVIHIKQHILVQKIPKTAWSINHLNRQDKQNMFSYLNPEGSFEMVLDLSETERGLVWRRRYSSSPVSPWQPMFLQPYPKGLAGPACCFSVAGFPKKRAASSSSLVTTSLLTPWFITLKNPYSSHALTINCDTLELSRERSTVGIPKAFVFLVRIGVGEGTTILAYN